MANEKIPKKKRKVTELYFNEYDSTAEIYTYNTKLKKRLIGILGYICLWVNLFCPQTGVMGQLFGDHFTLESIPLWVTVWVRWLTHVFGGCNLMLKIRKTTVF